MIGGRVVRFRSMDTAAAAVTTAGSRHQRRKKQQQQQQQQLQRRRRSTTTASQHHQHHRHQQQQPGGRRRAMPVVRRSYPAVTDDDTDVTSDASRAWQPSRQHHSMVKRPSRVYRELCLAWNSRVGSQNTNAPAHRVQALFNDLGLYPTSTQVAEMMQCVMKCANRSSPVYMTFGEFCLLAKKLKNGLDRGIPRSVQFSRLLEKDQEKHSRLGVNKKNSITSRRVVLHHEDATDTTQHHGSSTYDVFLGGSCNPTTWRKDLAVPYLEEAGVSFYNPQVDHWSQELIEIEHAAKENASILFFVIDSQTRNVVTDIETANFAGYRGNNNLVLVIHSQDVVAGSVIAGERVSSEEAKDIKEALAVLHDITSAEGVLVFDNIPLALSKIVQILKEQNNHQNMMTDIAGEENTTTYRKIRDAFNMFDTNASGKINIVDVRMAVRLLADQNLSENEVLALMSEPAGNSNGMAAEDRSNDQVCTFDQFYAIASKYNLQRSADKHNCRNGDTGGGRTTYRTSVGGRSPPLCSVQERSVAETTRSPKTTDIYLAGESGDDIRWAEEIAIPMIKKSNLSYHAAARMDISVLLDARTVLFVIPNNSRSLATMTMAAYCIAKNSGGMVLCIQNLSNNDCMVRGEKLTQTAINDYNRGRMYLADLAARERVPVFESVTEAVELAIQKSL